MNSLYFRCEGCKRYVDAGYRWAYCALVQPGIVAEDDYVHGGSNLPTVNVQAVLAASEYWQAPDGDHALRAQLERIKEFLSEHSDHQLSFGDLHRFHRPSEEWLEWLCDDEESELLPRHFVEVLGFTGWGQVQRFVEQRRSRPWWWSNPAARVAARRRFEELAQGVRHGECGA